MMRIEKHESAVTIGMSWDEAVRLGSALDAGHEGRDDIVGTERADGLREAMQFLCVVLWDSAGRFVGDVDIVASDRDGLDFVAHVHRTVDSVTIGMSCGDARRLCSIMEAGVKRSRSSAEYYLRYGLSQALIKEFIVALANGDQVEEIPFVWGERCVEVPTLVSPPQELEVEEAWVVIRTDNSPETMARSFVVETVWRDPANAHQDAQSRNAACRDHSDAEVRSRWDVNIVDLVVNSTMDSEETAHSTGSYERLFLVGCVMGDAGDEALFPGSLWRSECDAKKEKDRCNEMDSSYSYQVWDTWMGS